MTPSHRSAIEVEPDYRYTLANERTFLAWTRTSLTVLAGAVGFSQIGWDLGPGWLRLVGALLLAVLALLTAISGLVRWRSTDAAIRTGQAMPRARTPWLIGLGMVAMSGTLVAVVATQLSRS